MAQIAVQTDGITKTFGQTNGLPKSFGRKEHLRRALNGLSISVEEATLHGIVGPNGCGKTTLFRCLVDLIRPDSGSIQLFGQNALAVASRSTMIAGALQPVGIRLDLTVNQNLFYLARLLGSKAAERVPKVLKSLDLEEYADSKVKTLSHGYRQRCAIAMALLNRPRILILDEPFNGLDPLSVDQLSQFLKRFKKLGGTALISSHQLSDLEIICDAVTCIIDGAAVDTYDASGGTRDRSRFEKHVLALLKQRETSTP